MKTLLAKVIGALSAPHEPRRGTVQRVGPWFGPSQIYGLVLMLQGDSTPYIVLRDNQDTHYPAGLTHVGDTVIFEADVNGIVGLSTFRNLTLDGQESTLRMPLR
jgi:hypothetical protein